ncbi:MAG: hypothetical protein ACTHU0_19255 [Kofleriaceae bacterium]
MGPHAPLSNATTSREEHEMMNSTGKHFFRADDHGVRYWVVARDLNHAKRVMRDCGIEFGVSSSEAGKDPAWEELDAERAGHTRCDTSEDDRGRGMIPLTECDLGEWFCSER